MTTESDPTPLDPPWLERAMRHLGCRELTSEGKLNPQVKAFFRVTRFPVGLINKKTAWCSAFACSMLEEAGYKSPRSAAAKAFLTWGKELLKMRRGAVCIFRRGALDAETGHVGFYLGETATELLVLGGNQKNCVSPQRYPKAHLIAVRWPTETTAPMPEPSGSRVA